MKKHIDHKEFPLVSIITPLYNSEKYIVETIESVKKQTYLNWEHFIVDDASTDQSGVIALNLYREDPRGMIIKLDKKRGVSYCRNLATEKAKGKYIAYIDSDDLWHPEKLEVQIRMMEEKGHLVSCTNYLQINENSDPLNKRIVTMPTISYNKQHSNNYIGNLTGIYNAEVLGKIIAPDIKKRQDWAVWLEAIKRSKKPAFGIHRDLAYYRVRKNSLSSNKIDLLKYNFLFYRRCLNYSVFSSFLYLLRFLFEYFFVRPKFIQRL